MNNIEEEILNDLGKEMSDSIDFEIISDIMCDIQGWTRVEMFYYAMGEVDKWLKDNCRAEYRRHKDKFIFEDSQDANWFKLRWL